MGNSETMPKLVAHWVRVKTGWQLMPKMNPSGRCYSLCPDNAAPRTTSSGRFWKVEHRVLSGRMSLSASSSTCAGQIFSDFEEELFVWRIKFQKQSPRHLCGTPQASLAGDPGRGRVWAEAGDQEVGLQRPDPGRQLHPSWRYCFRHQLLHIETHQSIEVKITMSYLESFTQCHRVLSICSRILGIFQWVLGSKYPSWSTSNASWREGLALNLPGNLQWVFFHHI